MKQIKPSDNPHHWPRHEVKAVECRKRDLVIRIADWTRRKYQPAFDVEVYIGGVYDWNESKTFTVRQDRPKDAARSEAAWFAHQQIARLL